MPAVDVTEAWGTPIPPLSAAASHDRAVTFTRDVAPILRSACARCHRPGSVAPFALLSYKDAAKRADDILDVVMSGQMPPWKPRAGAGVFRDALRLSAVEKETIAAWVKNGRPEGNRADLPPLPVFNDGWQLGTPDLVLTVPEPFQVPAAGKDVYWAFALPVNLAADATINGLEFRPGNRRAVHHSRIYLDNTGDARRRDAADSRSGFLGYIGPAGTAELPYPGIGGWTPGMTPRLAPDGVGRAVPAGSDVVVRVHYHPTGKPEEDRSTVGLYFTKEPVTRKMVGFTFCSNKIDIPPGEKRHTIIISSYVKADVHLYSIVPHAHYLCREFRMAATHPDGTVEPLLWIDDWDMDWQDQYRYIKPVPLKRGTLLTFVAYFDNTEDNPQNPHKPPRRVHYGLGTDDEMCACHLEMLPDDARGYAAYPEKSPFGL